jgi:hypothetical protein
MTPLCRTCWWITMIGILSMIVIGVGAMFHDVKTFHRIAFGGVAVLFISLIADRIHKRHT